MADAPEPEESRTEREGSYPRGNDSGAEGRQDDAFPSPNELLGTFLSEPSLWPVLIVALASGGAFGAAMLVLAFGDRNPFAAAALLLVTGMTLDVGFRARRNPAYRNPAKIVAMLWVAALALAALAFATGIADA